MQEINVGLEKKQIEFITRYAAEHGISVSEATCKAILLFQKAERDSEIAKLKRESCERQSALEKKGYKFLC